MSEQSYPEPPVHIKVLKNGAGYDMNKKRIVDAPGTYADAPYNITKENAREMRARRTEKTQERIRTALVEQAQERGINVLAAPDAIGHAAGVLFGRVLDGDGTLRDQNRVVWDVAHYAGVLESKETTQNNVQINQISVDAGVLRDILSATGGQIIDIDPE